LYLNTSLNYLFKLFKEYFRYFFWVWLLLNDELDFIRFSSVQNMSLGHLKIDHILH